MGRRIGFVTGLLVMFFSTLPSGAATCGGATPCQCGDTVGPGLTATLTADLNCAAVLSDGLTLASGSTLNCQNFKIDGPDLGQPDGTQTGRYGIRILNANNVTQNLCRARGYERGLNIAASSDVTVLGGKYNKNTRYGINVGVNSANVLIDGVVILLNGDEGIHLGGPFLGPITLQNAEVFSNSKEGVYLLHADGTVVQNSRVYDNSTDPSGSYPDINIDETLNAVVTNCFLGNIARVIQSAAGPLNSFSMCLSSTAGTCQ